MSKLKFDVDLNTSKAMQKLTELTRDAVGGRLKKGASDVGNAAIDAAMLPVTKGFGTIVEGFNQLGREVWFPFTSKLDKILMDTTLGQRAQEQTFGQLGMGAAFMSEDAISGVMGVQRQILQLQDQARLKTEKVQVERYPSKATQSVRDATEFGRSVVELIALQTMSNETLNRIGGAIDSVRDFFSRNPFSPGNH